MEKRTGGCNCGKVRFQVEGNPIRVGVCHCQICRKDTGSSFNFFAVWSAKNVATAGDTESWMHSTDHRHFCVTCGSSLYSVVDGANEIEIRVGAFDDAPSNLFPTYELWLNRREQLGRDLSMELNNIPAIDLEARGRPAHELAHICKPRERLLFCAVPSCRILRNSHGLLDFCTHAQGRLGYISLIGRAAHQWRRAKTALTDG